MTTINRGDVKAAIVSSLQSALVPGVVQAVYDYEPPELQVAPVLILLSAGSSRKLFGKGAQIYHNAFRFSLRIFVLAPDENIGWTAQQAEQMLDDIEQAVADWALQNWTNQPYWEHLYLDGNFSQIMPVTLRNGTPYYIEGMMLVAEVTDG